MTNHNMPPTIAISSFGDDFNLTPALATYPNGRLAIRFEDEEGPFATLTTNLPDQHLNEGEFFAKSWSENRPLFIALLEQGWIELTGREVQSGHIFPTVVRPIGPLLNFLRGNHTIGF